MANVRKRFLSTIMVLLMVFSLTVASSVTAFAEDGSTGRESPMFFNDLVQEDDNQYNNYNFGPNAYEEAEKAVANHEADSIEDYSLEQFKLWYRSDPAFCAAIALHLDETGASGEVKLLSNYSVQPVDVRAAFATEAFIANPDDWMTCVQALDELLKDADPTIEELHQYTSAMYMVPKGLDGQYPLVVKRNSQNSGGHALKLELNGITVLFRMECHGQPVGLTYWEEIVVPGTNKTIDDQLAAEPEPEPEPEPVVVIDDPEPPIVDPEPIEPPIPVEPIDPVEPTDPEDPEEPTPPIEPVDPEPVTPVEPVEPEPEPEPEPDYVVYLLSDIANATETVYSVTEDGAIVFDPNYDYGTYRTSLTVTPNGGDDTGIVMITTYTTRDTRITHEGTMITDGYEYLQDDNGNKYLVSEHTADVIQSGLKSLSFDDVDEYIDSAVFISVGSKSATAEPAATEEPTLATAAVEPDSGDTVVAEPDVVKDNPIVDESPVKEEPTPTADPAATNDSATANDAEPADVSIQDNAEPADTSSQDDSEPAAMIVDDVIAPEEPKAEPTVTEEPATSTEAPENTDTDSAEEPVVDSTSE